MIVNMYSATSSTSYVHYIYCAPVGLRADRPSSSSTEGA